MEIYAIPLSIAGGLVFYLYVAWLAPDRDDPRNARKVLRNSVGVLAIALALTVLLILPWAIFEHWSVAQVLAADLPYRKMRSTVWAIYGAATAGVCGLFHAFVVKYILPTRNVDG
jgi:hypothetical protein